MRPGFDPWVGKIPWKREKLPPPIFWPGEFHRLNSPWGHKELANEKFSSILNILSELEVKSESRSVMSDSLWPHGLYSPWNSPGQNTGVGSLSLLQGIFPIQGSNPGLPHYRQIIYQLSHKGSPRILEWVAYPFSSGSSRLRKWTGVSCIEGGFFTN